MGETWDSEGEPENHPEAQLQVPVPEDPPQAPQVRFFGLCSWLAPWVLLAWLAQVFLEYPFQHFVVWAIALVSLGSLAFFYRHPLYLPKGKEAGCLVLAAFLAAGGGLVHLRDLQQRRLQGCKETLSYELACALEIYATDNNGAYPLHLEKLVPQYLPNLPSCPAAGEPYHYQAYTPHQVSAYTLCCAGHHHGLASSHYPQYSSFSGLIMP